jgi:phosphopantothenoylcysteine decarboxylase/phosphopantothenate--cysteine ligase
VSQRGRAAGKVVLVGITGGVAAYKVGYVVSGLRQEGAEVHVLMTAAAAQFVQPLTFRALSQQPVLTDMWAAENPWEEPHVTLGARADLFIIAPATAHTLAKLALGLADDLVTATALATRAPLLIAPAMSDLMYAHPTVDEHLEKLRSRGAHIVGPEYGRLASGREGMGRMSEPETILREALRLLTGTS